MRPHKITSITRCIIGAAALLIFVLKPTYGNAGDEDVTYTSILKFSAGIIAAFSIHEGGHALVGWMTNTDMDWRRGDINQPLKFTEDTDSDAKGAAINAAGLISQAIAGEVILRAEKIDKDDAFVRGMMAWNILNPIMYAMDYWFFHKTNSNDGDSYEGDLAGVERYTSTPTAHGFALCMAGIAAFQANRFLQTQSWAPDWLKTKSHRVNFRPLPSGGLVMTYDIPF
jgi:hypothetical protein